MGIMVYSLLWVMSSTVGHRFKQGSNVVCIAELAQFGYLSLHFPTALSPKP